MTGELLSPGQMAHCDALTVAAGTPGTVLMERAGKAIADHALGMLAPGAKVLVLAGPGNNGGDGYVAARLLVKSGVAVELVCLLDPVGLRADAKSAFKAWGGKVRLAQSLLVDGEIALPASDLVIDALFGAGLARPLEGLAADLVRTINASGIPVLAVDLPSGLDGLTGKAGGPAIQASSTVTFHALKPAHVLYPGRLVCGRVELADIGILDEAIETAGYTARLTGSWLWRQARRSPGAQGHKYDRGHALICAGPPEKAGAGFLAAGAALRAGAGLVTLAAPATTLGGSIGQYPALMRTRCDNAGDLARLLADRRLRSCVLGPGLAPDEATRQMVYAALQSQATLVLDAGALTAFAGMAGRLFEAIHARCAPVILTPHGGEFSALFGAGDNHPRLVAAQAGARRSGAVLVLKGPDSVIAGPSGLAHDLYVNGNAPPWLATAGSGDVLSGILAGLLAGGPDDVPACVALAVWLHGCAGQVAGPALVASDLEAALGSVLRRLLEESPQGHFQPREAGWC